MKKPLALIVEDSAYWSKIFEELLIPYCSIAIARNYHEVQSIIKKRKDVRIAIVDIRLTGDFDVSGLAVLKTLKEIGVTSIATSAYGNAETVRDAFTEGKVVNFWFKDGKIVELGKIVEDVVKQGNTVQNKSSKRTQTGSISNTFWIFPLIILVSLVVVFITLTVVAQKISPDLVGSVIISGAILFVFIVLSLLLFINKITNKDFKEIVRDLFKKVP